MMYGILKDKKVTPVSEMKIWPSMENRTVGRNTFGEAHVSTVFLVIDHGFGFSTPQWFETMVFGGKFDQEQRRYETWAQAAKGHIDMCNKVKHSQKWYVRLWDFIKNIRVTSANT